MPEVRKKIAEAFYEWLQERVAADPAMPVCAWRLVLLLIDKRSDH
jgi:hypothetical protein